MSLTRLDLVRRHAGVTDGTWSPPPAPEDHDPYLADGIAARRDDWPDWVTSAEGYPIGSRWRLTEPACIVAPLLRTCATLALTDDPSTAGRYGIAAGTTFVLVETYDPEQDRPDASDPAMYDFLERVEGWRSRIYRIADGPSAGILLRLPSDPRGGRLPLTAALANAALVPAEETSAAEP